jgi:hypothetical protein
MFMSFHVKTSALIAPRWICAGLCAVFTAALPAQQSPQAGELQRRVALHSPLFVLHDRLGKPLTAMAPDVNGVVTFHADFINDYFPTPGALRLTSEEQAAAELAHMVQANPVVVTARAGSHRSAFTPSKAFLYSDWDFEVSRVFKNESAEAAQPFSTITVTRPGGALVHNGIRYIAEDKTFPEFQEGGVYILFLQPLADGSHSFRVFAGDCFLVSGFTVSRIDDYQRQSKLSERLVLLNPETFAETVDNTVRNVKGVAR